MSQGQSKSISKLVSSIRSVSCKIMSRHALSPFLRYAATSWGNSSDLIRSSLGNQARETIGQKDVRTFFWTVVLPADLQ